MAAFAYANAQSIKYLDKLIDVTQDYTILANKIKFDKEARQGSSIRCPVALTRCYGFTPGGTTPAATSLATPEPTLFRYAEVSANENALSQLVPIGDVFRNEGGEVSFINTSKDIPARMAASAGARLDDEILYGRSPVAAVSDIAASTTGDPVGGAHGGTFTVDAASWRDGFWFASEQMLIDLFTLTSSATAENVSPIKITTVNDAPGSRVVGFSCASGDVAAIEAMTTGFAYYRSVKTGAATFNQMLGMYESLSVTSGSVFNIPVTFSGWKGRTIAAGGAELSINLLNQATARLAGIGLKKNLIALVSTKGWIDLMDDMAALRAVDYSYNSKNLVTGSESLTFHGLNQGKVEVIAHPAVKWSDAFVIDPESWIRGGSTEWTFDVPGYDNASGRVPGTNYIEVFAYTDQCLLSKMLSHNVLITGLDSSL